MEYARRMSNYESAYDASSRMIRPSPVYVPLYPQGSMRAISPNFRLDLYEPRESSPSSSYRSISPVIVHHHRVYSPPIDRAPSPSLTQTVSKLRQINDELCHTLAQCDLTYRPEPARPHHHVHHHPVSHRSRPSSEHDSSSSVESEPELKKSKAKVTYKIRVPRRRPRSSQSLSQMDQMLISTSDAYEQDDPMTIDIYPRRDQGFVKQVRNRPNNQKPWLEDRPARRNSYSEEISYRTPRTPRGPDYSNRPITVNNRLARGEGIC